MLFRSLLYAVSHPYHSIIKYLFSLDADYNVKDSDNRSIFDITIGSNKKLLFEIITTKLDNRIDEISIELAKRAGELRMNRTFDIMQKDWKEGRKKPSPEYLKSYKKFQDDKRRYERKLNKEQKALGEIN